jgi:hypothetical protein
VRQKFSLASEAQNLAKQNSWLVAIGFTALLGLMTFCARVAVTAWFDQPCIRPSNTSKAASLRARFQPSFLDSWFFHSIASREHFKFPSRLFPCWQNSPQLISRLNQNNHHGLAI